MCGIAGLAINRNAGDSEWRLVENMVDAIRRRGPDDRGFFHDGGAVLGMCRLSIIDLSGGHQPIANEKGDVTLVCNGEIYNHEELRVDLISKGHKFKTGSDVEVALHLYEDLGLEFVKKLRGMFSLAIWDSRSQRMILARDRIGIKPLYYENLPEGGLIFGSELKTLTTQGVGNREVDRSALQAYFTRGYIPNPQTIFSGVHKLEPGHLLVWEKGKSRQERYWDLEFHPDRGPSESDWIEGFIDLFKSTLKLHLRSDVPLGAFLSGGIDSSLVVALMSGLVDKPVNTFTMGFGGSSGGFLDERKYSRQVSRRYNTVHHEYEVHPDLTSVIEDIVHAFDEPFADDSVIPSYYICRETAQHVKVALSGLGGDELFGGYERYLGFQWSERYAQIPQWIRRFILSPLVNAMKESRNGHYTINHMKRFVRASDLEPAERYDSFVSIFSSAQVRQLLKNDVGDDDTSHDYLASNDFNLGSRDLLSNALLHDVRTYLPEDILALSDRLSMWHGLELRVPFVDHKVMEYCSRIPSSFKIRGFQKKVLLKRAAKPYLPEEVISHRKQGFASPMASWFRGDLRDYLQDSLSPSNLNRHGWLDVAMVQKLIEDHMSRKELNDRKLFGLLMFQRWYENNFCSLDKK